jgi:hypothetical protein
LKPEGSGRVSLPAHKAYARDLNGVLRRKSRIPDQGQASNREPAGSANRQGEAMSDEELKAELERLRNENEALKKGASAGVRMKVSEKGAVSIYGMGRFPVTLYKEQWLTLLDMSEEIRAFIAANEAKLKAKE